MARKPACPDRNLLRKVTGLPNRRNGKCQPLKFGRDTCLGKKMSCCENIYGDFVCVRVARLPKDAPVKASAEVPPPPQLPPQAEALQLDDSK